MSVKVKNNPYVSDQQVSEALLNISPACVKVLDINGVLLYLDSTGAKLLELKNPASAVGADWLGFWKGEDEVAAKQAIRVAIAGGVGTFEGYYETEAGSKKWWDVMITALVDDTNEVTRLLAISRDITDRRESERMLTVKNIELERLVVELREKQHALDAAESMLESLLKQSRS